MAPSHAAVETVRRMRLGQQVDGITTPTRGQKIGQRDQIPRQHPPHQTVTDRNGPGPNRAETWATANVTGAGPSAARMAAG